MTTTEQRLADALRASIATLDVAATHLTGDRARMMQVTANAQREALAAHDAQQAANPMAAVNAAHDKLSAALEDPSAGNDDVRDAAIDLCGELNALAAAGVRHA